MMYDVIVIGAGPAGCTAAKILSENGLRVLIVERHKLPRCRSCSGILIRKSLNLVKTYFQEVIPNFVMCTATENRGMIFIDDKGKEYRFEQKGVNVWRGSFDYWLLSKALEKGAEILENTSVVSCLQNTNGIEVTLSGEKERVEYCKHVIDCEGAAGIVKRRLLNIEKKYIFTYQTFYEGDIELDPHYFYAYLQPEFSEYDAWFNVKDEQIVLGVAVKDAKKAETYHRRFVCYMEENFGASLRRKWKTEKWLMPQICSPYEIYYGKEGVLFSGEAAGFLNPMGEGISSAIESGFHAARSILENFGNYGAALASYRKKTQELKEYMQRQWHLLSLLSNKFSFMRKRSEIGGENQ